MQFNVSKNSAVPVKSENRSKLCIPPTLFEQQPGTELTLDQFELLSMERLQLLRSIEMLKARGFEEKELYEKIREVSSSQHFLFAVHYGIFIIFCRRKESIFEENQRMMHCTDRSKTFKKISFPIIFCVSLIVERRTCGDGI